MSIVLDALKTRNLKIKKERKDSEAIGGYDSAETTGGYESAKVLMVSHKDIQDAWIMDSRSGCTIKSENGVMKVTKGSLVKLRETLRYGMYVLKGTTVLGSAANASDKVTDMSTLWHKRLAHDEAFGKFLEWKKQVENQTGRKVKYLRTNNGLEFVNNKFNNFCKYKGIMRDFTFTYTPQQMVWLRVSPRTRDDAERPTSLRLV
ncbi:Integrase, catalytic core [Cucumis melo var. makuwa]|uniref:Integrase, catalytic core n=1 Tax=Cucumis melo var. makuwa TaxID=1194695 RepID=A0A5A7U3B7_CUCMM|nr:Integrase, catalytic core [Cucumis melo var. makuwa]